VVNKAAPKNENVVLTKGVEFFRGSNQQIESVSANKCNYKIIKKVDSLHYKVELASVSVNYSKESKFLSTLRSFRYKGKSFKIIGIGDSVFSNSATPPKIKIPENISYIGEEAFSNRINLKTVTFENGLKKIGAYAFANCKNLSELPNMDSVGIKKIGNGCFLGCSSLKEIALSQSMQLGTDIVEESCSFQRKKIHSS